MLMKIVIFTKKPYARLGLNCPNEVDLEHGGDDPLANCSIACDELHNILKNAFYQVRDFFGFQESSADNQLDALQCLIASRAESRNTTPEQAIETIYQDYLVGTHSNYRLWAETVLGTVNIPAQTSAHLQLRLLATYFCIWGEAANLRFCPELLCFILNLAIDAQAAQLNNDLDPGGKTTAITGTCHQRLSDDTDQVHVYSGSDTNVSNDQPSFLNEVIKPLYDFIRAQIYKQTANYQLVRKFHDHADIIGYDDCNELFWSIDGLTKIVLKDGSFFMEIAPSQRYKHLSQVDWKKAFTKTFKERRSTLHLLVNFLPVWIIHTCFFYPFLANAVLDQITDVDIATRISWISIHGCLATLMVLGALIVEPFFTNHQGSNKSKHFYNILITLALLVLNAVPVVTVFFFGENLTTAIRMGLSILSVSSWFLSNNIENILLIFKNLSYFLVRLCFRFQHQCYAYCDLACSTTIMQLSAIPLHLYPRYADLFLSVGFHDIFVT
jgi:1,3-beta-glucan synthase